MAPVYADHPFKLINTPKYLLPEGQKADIFDNMASEMVVIHNSIIRGLNAIYLQAPHIAEKDVLCFANFMLQWVRMLELHHGGEEKHFFPTVERLSGETGIMATNIGQHEAFHHGKDLLKEYVTEILAEKAKYDGAKVVSIIDGFGEILRVHLNDEIPTILALRKFGEEKMLPLVQAFDEEGEQVMKAFGLTTGIPWWQSCHDLEFENGLYAAFPTDTKAQILMWVTRNILWFVHSNWWKFGAVDRSGKMQPLYACSK